MERQRSALVIRTANEKSGEDGLVPSLQGAVILVAAP